MRCTCIRRHGVSISWSHPTNLFLLLLVGASMDRRWSGGGGRGQHFAIALDMGLISTEAWVCMNDLGGDDSDEFASRDGQVSLAGWPMSGLEREMTGSTCVSFTSSGEGSVAGMEQLQGLLQFDV